MKRHDSYRLHHTYDFTRENIKRSRRSLWPSFHPMIGADRSFVTVGRSFTVAKGFSPLWGKEKQSRQKYLKMGIVFFWLMLT